MFPSAMGSCCQIVESTPLSWLQPGLFGNFYRVPWNDQQLNWMKSIPKEEVQFSLVTNMAISSFLSLTIQRLLLDCLHTFITGSFWCPALGFYIATQMFFNSSCLSSPSHPQTPLPSPSHLKLLLLPPSLLHPTHYFILLPCLRKIHLSCLVHSSLPNLSRSIDCSLVIIFIMANIQL